MLSDGKEATPEIAANVRVPDNVPPAGFAPSATVTLPAKPVAVLPRASSAVTRTDGLMGSPPARPRHMPREAGGRIPRGVERGHAYGRLDGPPCRGRRRLYGERELGRGPGCDGEGGTRAPGKPGSRGR